MKFILKLILLFILLSITTVKGGGPGYACAFEKDNYVGYYNEKVQVKLIIQNTTSCSDLDPNYTLDNENYINCDNGQMALIYINTTNCNQTISAHCTYTGPPSNRVISFLAGWSDQEGTGSGFFCSTQANLISRPAPQIVDIQINPTSSYALFFWQVVQSDLTHYPDPLTSTLKIFNKTDNSLVFSKSQTAVQNYGINASPLINNTIYDYRIDVCVLDNCNSTTDSFTTLQTVIITNPSPTPSPSPGPTPPGGISQIHDLKLVSVSGPVWPPNVISQGSKAQFTFSIQNNENIPDAYDVVVTNVKTGRYIFTDYQTQNPINSLSTATYSGFTLDSTGFAEGRHTLSVIISPKGTYDTYDDDNSKEFDIFINPPVESFTISNVRSSLITTSSAMITWETSKEASGSVFYSNSETNPNLRVDGIGSSPKHSVRLSSLQTNTIYYYRVSSTAGGYTAESTILNFTTASSDENSCQDANSCEGGFLVIKKLVGAECVESERIDCATMVSGCMRPYCAGDRCYGEPDKTICKDVCRGPIMKKDAGCDLQSDSYAECRYQEIPCNELNLCRAVPVKCGGGEDYFCIKMGGVYQWSTDRSSCDIAIGGEKPISVIPEIESSSPLTQVSEGFGAVKDKNQTREEEVLVRGISTEKRNFLNITGFIMQPDIFRPGSNVLVGVMTTSGKDLLPNGIICAPPMDSEASCRCVPGFQNTNRSMRCFIENAQEGAYTITLSNGEESGAFELMLQPGKTALFTKVNIPSRQNEGWFWIFVIIAGVLLLLMAFFTVNNYRKKRKYFKGLLRTKELIPQQREYLKLSFMKGTISSADFGTAMAALDKKEVETESALKQYYEKHPQKKPKAAKEEPKLVVPDRKEGIEGIMNEIKFKSQSQKDRGDLDDLLNELEKKGVGTPRKDVLEKKSQ